MGVLAMLAPLSPTPSQVLFELLVDARLAEAEELVDGAARGRRLADVLVNLLEPVVYRIGADVSLDVLGPDVEVTAVAFVRATLARLARRRPGKAEDGRCALAAVVPGEAHDLGLQMVGALLAREGWRVAVVPPAESSEALVARAQASGPELVCLSVTTADLVPATARLVRALHLAVPKARVLVGGLAFRLVPERAVRVGADLFAEDARAAVEVVKGTFGT
jgi:methanogenic corrinoid protein MtbC1